MERYWDSKRKGALQAEHWDGGVWYAYVEGYRCAHCGVSKRQKLKYYLGYAHKYFINSLSDPCEKEVHFIN